MKRSVLIGLRVVAFFLVAGGLLGIIGSWQTGQHCYRLHDTGGLISATVAIPLFIGSIFAGVSLWRARPAALGWAKILFALQTVQLALGRFTFEFSTFLSFRLMVGNTTHRIGGNIGSSFDLHWWAQPLGGMFGVNIVAVLVLLFLQRVRNS